MTYHKVLILDADEAPYPLVVARSLGSAGYEVHLGFPYGFHAFSAYSKYCKNHVFYPDPSYASNDFQLFISKLAGKYDIIIPTMEKTQLAVSKIKDILEENGTIVPIPSYNTLIKAVNKAKILEICSQININIPKTHILNSPPKIDEVIKQFGLPFIIKTSTEINIPPGPGNRYFIFKNKPSQSHFNAIFKKFLRQGPVILQEWIKGIGIGASFIFSKKSKLIAFFGHRRILEAFPDGGPSVIAETYLHLDALKYGIRLLKALKWQGVAMVEFRMGYDGKIYFMELNPRFWGTLPLAIASNIDFPRLLVESYIPHPAKLNKHIYIRKRIFVKGLTIPLLFRSSIKAKNLSFSSRIIKSSFKIFKYGFPFIFEFQMLDLKPLLKQLLYSIKGYFSKRKPSKINGIIFGPALPYNKLKRLKVQSIIDLREEHEKKDRDMKINRINYYSFPIKDDSAPTTNSFYSVISMIDNLIKKGPVYIHCRLGRGRSPMVVIAYLVSKGMPLEVAYQAVYNARPYAYLNLVQKKALYDFYEKARFVEG